MILRDYQKDIVNRGLPILNKNKFLYLAMEVRTGKTATSLSMVSSLPVTDCLFLTKKKAIYSIQDDYDKLNLSYNLTVINYESIHKLPKNKWQCIILDEAHGLGAFPKASKRAKQVKTLIVSNKSYVILLSGTPTPESYSQMYHQVYGIPSNPYCQYKNFYRFSDHYVNVRIRPIGGIQIRDYSRGSEDIIYKMKPYTISYTQKEAGFKVETNEETLYVETPSKIKSIIKKLTTDLVVQGKEEVILADTAVKLMSKTHQLYSGTVKFESGKSMVIDTFKAEYIKYKFKGKKIAIFYKFTAEWEALKLIFKDTMCNTLEEFNNTDKNIALQIVSGREGISLRKAEALVYYNIDFSATSYWQSRDRMTTKDRLYNKVYWIFSKNGIEDSIYKSVVKKKDYTLRHFKRDLLTLN
tara:strand:- start:3828 stop:5060 length:1233 start_codon:yes stop_codon:yes gene_type:complete